MHVVLMVSLLLHCSLPQSVRPSLLPPASGQRWWLLALESSPLGCQQARGGTPAYQTQGVSVISHSLCDWCKPVTTAVQRPRYLLVGLAVLQLANPRAPTAVVRALSPELPKHVQHDATAAWRHNRIGNLESGDDFKEHLSPSSTLGIRTLVW